MRKLSWIEIRVSRVRPKRIISRMSVGDQNIVGYGWDGGEHVGVLSYPAGYVRFTDEGGVRYLKLPEMRNGQTVELDGKLSEMILDVGNRGLLFTS